MGPRAGLDGLKISSPPGFDPRPPHHTHTHTHIYIYIKVKCSRYRPGVVQRVRRGIALLFHDLGTRRG